VKTKKFPAKSSRIRSYAHISASTSSFRLEDDTKTSAIIVQQSKEIIRKALAVRLDVHFSLARAFVVSHICRTERDRYGAPDNQDKTAFRNRTRHI
jgi:hypothetical protein